MGQPQVVISKCIQKVAEPATQVIVKQPDRNTEKNKTISFLHTSDLKVAQHACETWNQRNATVVFKVSGSVAIVFGRVFSQLFSHADVPQEDVSEHVKMSY